MVWNGEQFSQNLSFYYSRRLDYHKLPTEIYFDPLWRILFANVLEKTRSTQKPHAVALISPNKHPFKDGNSLDVLRGFPEPELLEEISLGNSDLPLFTSKIKQTTPNFVNMPKLPLVLEHFGYRYSAHPAIYLLSFPASDKKLGSDSFTPKEWQLSMRDHTTPIMKIHGDAVTLLLPTEHTLETCRRYTGSIPHAINRIPDLTRRKIKDIKELFGSKYSPRLSSSEMLAKRDLRMASLLSIGLFHGIAGKYLKRYG
jgi:hypothetical protein